MKRSMAWMAAALIAALITAVGAQNAEKGADDSADAAETNPAPKSAAQQALEQLRQRRQDNKLIEPTVASPARAVSSPPPPPVGAVAPADLGFAAGQKKPTLRREGEFVIARRGRLVPAPKSNHMVFQFDADSEQSPEPPMVMLPCRLLESMENLVHQSGDQTVFNVTGQVFVYRGLNYLLPTMFTLAVDKGNLQ